MRTLEPSHLTIKDFSSRDWQTVIRDVSEQQCWHYMRRFKDSANDAKVAGDATGKVLFELLANVSSLMLVPDSVEVPQRPWMVSPNGRSAAIEDFASADLKLLAELAPSIRDAELRARVADLTWITKHANYRLAQLAVTSYRESARALEEARSWPEMADRLERAVRLAATLGRQQTLFAETLSDIEAVLDRHDIATGWLVLPEQMMNLLLEFKRGNPETYAHVAERAALHAVTLLDWHTAERYWLLKARWHQRAQDAAGERVARGWAAEMHVWAADDEFRRGNFIGGVAHLADGVDAYRQIRDHERADELHRALLAYQPRAEGQMQTFPQPIDYIDPWVKQSEARVRGKPLPQALLQFARGGPLHTMETLRNWLEQRQHDLRVIDFLATHEIVDARGRVVARKQSLASSDPEEVEAAKWAEMHRTAGLYRHVFAHAFILPAWQQIVEEHAVRLADLMPFVLNNSFVPQGRELLYALGLHAGVMGDFMVATHLLIPQLENSLRILLAQHDAEKGNDADHRAGSDGSLNDLLTERYDAMCLILSEDVAFDLQGLLVSRFGANLRNTTSHGLLDHTQFRSTQACYLWWLTLQLCAVHVVARNTRQSTA